MKYNFKKKITAILAAILAAVIFMTIPVSAIEWNGSTGGGGGGGSTSSTSGGYSIPYTGNYAVGYRFSRIDYFGITKNKPIDILCSTFTIANYPKNDDSSISGGDGYSRAKSAEWFNTKYNKVDLSADMYNPDARGSTSKTLANVFTDTDVLDGATLPPEISKIESTLIRENILDSVCKAIGMTDGSADLQNGDKVLVEPIFLMKIANTDYAMTISELGMFGGYMFGWDNPTSTTGNSGSYGFIAKFLNKIWPSTLYSTDESFWYAGYDAVANTSGPASNSKGLISFRNLILYGFGIGFAYNNPNEPIVEKTVDLYPIGVEFYDQQIGGTRQTTLLDGYTYWPRYVFYNNGDMAVNAKLNIYCQALNYQSSGNGFFEENVIIGAYSYYTYNPQKSICLNEYVRYTYNTTSGGIDFANGYPAHDSEWNIGRFLFNSMDITLLSTEANGYRAVETDTSNNYKEDFTNVYVPVDLAVDIEFYDKIGGTKQTSFSEGQTYYPQYVFRNYGNTTVKTKIGTINYPNNKTERENYDLQISAWSTEFIWGDPVTITKGRYFGDSGVQYDNYTYTQNKLKHYAQIYLNSDSKVAVERSEAPFYKNTDNNQNTVYNQFSPKQPNINQWVVDKENAASSWITSAVNNHIIYSGEQTDSQVRFTNLSSFKLQIDEYFKSILGLNNNLLASYSKTNDSTWHTSGGVWDRETGTFRAKNTVNGTNEMLYLCASAGERSYAKAMGVNIDEANHITENINLNKQAFFKSQTNTNTSGGTVTVNWDNNARTLLLNGTMDTSFIDSVSAINVPCDLRKGNTYKVTVEYVSGSVSSPNSPLNSCIAFETTYNNGSDRIYTDVNYPKCNAQNTDAVCTGQFTMSRDESAVLPWIWVYSKGGHKVTFNNYKVKIKLENITSTVNNRAYTTNLEGYTVIPTDLEASTISLFDAKTNKRIPDGTILKAGQEVYSETTYTNHTDTSVSVELQTKHDNNSYTEYYMTDEANMANSITSVKNSNPEIDWNKEDEILTVNGSYSRNRLLSQNEISPNKASGSSSDGKVSYFFSSNINLNKQAFFDNQIGDDAKGNNVSVVWDNDARTLTLNGTAEANFIRTVGISHNFKRGETYKVTIEYVSGSIKSKNNSPAACFAFDVSQNSGSERIHADVLFPNCQELGTGSVCTSQFTLSRNEYSISPWIWVNEGSSEKMTFSNYQVKIKIENITPESPDYLTLTLNGTIYGSDYIYSSPFPNVSVLNSDIGPGSTIRLTAEYVSGSITDYNDNNLTILAFSQYHDDWSNNGSNRLFADLWLPQTDACPGDSSTSWSFTTPYCGGSPNCYFSLGLHSRNYSTDTDSSVTFNNYTIKLKVEVVNYYEPVKETVISENIPIGNFDNYLLKIKNIGGNYVGKKASLVIQYLNSNRTLVDSEEFDIPTVNETISRGISPRNGSVYYRLVLKSDAGTGEKISYNNLKLNLLLRKKSMTQCNIASDSNSIHNETCVIAPNQSVTIRSEIFAISVLPHNKINLSAYIYIKGLTGNTEYEYVTTNNVISKSYVIETPFKPTVVQANSEYRRGITVITSFSIKNDSYSDFGNQPDIDDKGVLSANLKVYRTASLTGTPIASVDCAYAVPGNRKSTLVWFEWTVPVDSPDKLYAEMICDDNNRYSSSEFTDNGNNSKNIYCTFIITQPKVASTPDTTFAKKAPYWYEDGASRATVPSEAEGIKSVYNQEPEQIKNEASWSYYVTNGNSLKLVTETATLMGSSIDLIPDGTLSSYVGYDNKWNIKAGYGFKIDTEFKDNIHSTNVQSGYAVFPEFLYKVVDDNTLVNGYTNGAGVRIGFEKVLDKNPLCGGEYATYSTFEKTRGGKLILPNNDSSHTPTHFIPIWYPNSDYRINCYVADCWTPGGMLSGEIRSSALHINGNMYDDYRVSEK